MALALTVLIGATSVFLHRDYVVLNECDDEGKAVLLEACADGPGVDRARIHELIGREAVRFFDASLGAPRRE